MNEAITQYGLYFSLAIVTILIIKFLIKTIFKFALTLALMFVVNQWTPLIMPGILDILLVYVDFGPWADWIFPVLPFVLSFVVASLLSTLIWNAAMGLLKLPKRIFQGIFR
ncbi:MAG: hypothetical protein FWF59_14520 [Turicibacter sp.]|nr:hypothetical protein [Turicibacter sp.]